MQIDCVGYAFEFDDREKPELSLVYDIGRW